MMMLRGLASLRRGAGRLQWPGGVMGARAGAEGGAWGGCGALRRGMSAQSGEEAQGMVDLGASHTAETAFRRSCYYDLDWMIDSERMVAEAVERMVAYKIGCLAVTGPEGNVIGVISERDYVTKIGAAQLAGGDEAARSTTTKVREIATMDNLITARQSDMVQDIMKKMLEYDIRHMPIVADDDPDNVIGFLSIKDLIKEVVASKEDMIRKLSDFSIGEGAFLAHT